MAPELAIAAMENLPKGSRILDPMTGSGVVLRQALEHGLAGLGYDLDPLAVLMSQVWTTNVDAEELSKYVGSLLHEATSAKVEPNDLEWVDGATEKFIKFWFAEPQRNALAGVAQLLHQKSLARPRGRNRVLLNAAKLCLSRTIITKSGGASLADDTSHSRPHRTRTESDYSVFDGIKKAADAIGKICAQTPIDPKVVIRRGDARDLRGVAGGSIDAIITSPPYLNAIDYMRGHKLALVWLGFPIGDLAHVRSSSIGAERSAEKLIKKSILEQTKAEMLDGDSLTSAQVRMIERYIVDLDKLAARFARVLKPGANATYVVGNSCLRGTFVKNSVCMRLLSERHGLTLIREVERPLPENRRYLPVSGKNDNPLKKRMRTETVLTMQKAA